VKYLVANPVDIPKLKAMLENGAIDTDEQSQFIRREDPEHHDSSEHLANEDGDIFTKLPQELRDMVLLELERKDIANLRLASRAFRQLPLLLFKSLLTREKPYFWELAELEDGASKNHKREVNYFALWSNLQKLESDSLGFRNRKRVWHCIESCIEWISQIRDENKADQSGEEDLNPHRASKRRRTGRAAKKTGEAAPRKQLWSVC
jgi:hypothetical protein